MARCGDCDHYRSSLAVGVASGMCNAQKTGERSYKLVMYHDDATKCQYFKQLDASKVRTDSVNAPYDVHSWRPFKDYGEKKADVQISPDKVKDPRQWG